MKKISNMDDYRFPAMIWGIQLIVSILVIFVFTHAVVHGPHAAQRFDQWFSAFAAWDGEWYLRISENGYRSLISAAFFPLYPLLIRIVHEVFGLPSIVAGFIISNLAFLAAIILLFKLAKVHIGEKKARWALLLLVSFPTAFFFNMVYTESITLLLTVLFFYLLHKDKLLTAVLIGVLMSANKQIGAFLSLIGLIYVLKNRKSYPTRRFLARVMALCLVPFGLFGYMALLFNQFGDPLAFVKAQEFWHREAMIPIIHTIKFMVILLLQDQKDVGFWSFKIMMLVNGTLQLLVAAFVTWMFFERKKIIPFEMKVFALLSLLIGTTSGTYGNLQSFGRFMVVIFPVFIVWAHLFKRETVLMGVVFVMFTVKIILLGMFGNGYEIT